MAVILYRLDLTSGGLVHVDYDNLRLTSDGLVGELFTPFVPIAVDDYYTATSGTQLVVPAVTGILLNDTYTA